MNFLFFHSGGLAALAVFDVEMKLLVVCLLAYCCLINCFVLISQFKNYSYFYNNYCCCWCLRAALLVVCNHFASRQQTTKRASCLYSLFTCYFNLISLFQLLVYCQVLQLLLLLCFSLELCKKLACSHSVFLLFFFIWFHISGIVYYNYCCCCFHAALLVVCNQLACYWHFVLSTLQLLSSNC